MSHLPNRLAPLSALLLTLMFHVAALPVAAADEPQSARTLMEHRHWKRARARLEADFKARPNDVAVLSALAEVRAQFGDYDGAEAAGKEAVRLAPRDAQAHESLANALGMHAGHAGKLKAWGLAKSMRKEAETAVALDPKRIEARMALAQFHIHAPGIAGGDKKKAQVYVEEIAKIDAVEGELARAELAEASHDSVAVEAHYRRAVAADPKNVEAQLSLAAWCAAPWRAHWAEAEEHVMAARKVAPDRAAPLASLASLYAHGERWADLDALLVEAERDCPDSRTPWYQAARTLLSEGHDLPRAERYFRRYLEMEPEPGNPTFAHAHWRIAQVLEKQNRKPEAIAELETAVKLKPDLDPAKDDLKRLKK